MSLYCIKVIMMHNFVLLCFCPTHPPLSRISPTTTTLLLNYTHVQQVVTCQLTNCFGSVCLLLIFAYANAKYLHFLVMLSHCLCPHIWSFLRC